MTIAADIDRMIADLVPLMPKQFAQARVCANDMTSRIRVPELFCPFPSDIHQAAAMIEERTISWMKRCGYINSLSDEKTARASQFGIRAALVHPQGRVSAIQLASDLTVWLFLTDDVHVEDAATKHALASVTAHVLRFVRILRNPEDEIDSSLPSMRALRDLSRRLHRLANDEQIERITNGLIEYFLAATNEAAHVSSRTPPSVCDYIPARDAINCLRSVCFVFIELAGGFNLPGKSWCRPEMQMLVNLATRIVSNHHDLLSGLRELSNEMPMNLPAVIAHEQEVTLAEAFSRVAMMADRDMQEFVTLASRFAAMNAGRPELDYVEGLKAWIRGNLDWSLTTGRYRVGDYRQAA